MKRNFKINSKTIIKLIVAPIMSVTLILTGIPTGASLGLGPIEAFADEDEPDMISDATEPVVLDETVEEEADATGDAYTDEFNDPDNDPKQYSLSFEDGPTDVIRKLEYEQFDGVTNDFYGKKYKTRRPIDVSILMDDEIYGRFGAAMKIPGYRFDGWYVNEVDDGEKNRIKADAGLNEDAGFEIVEQADEFDDSIKTYKLILFTGHDVVIKANYVPDSYYVGYAANSMEAKNYHDNVVVNSTGGDFSVIKPAASGVSAVLASGEGSGEAWSTEAGTDGKKLRGWRLGRQDSAYSVDTNDKVYGLGEPITPLIDGEDPDFVMSEIENGSTMLLKEGEGPEVRRAVDNWMIAYYDYDHQLTLLDDEGNEIKEYTKFSESDVLPTGVSNPAGKTLYRWAKADGNGQATGTVFEPGTTLSDDGRKLGNAFETETREDGSKVKKLTLVPIYEDTYTFNLRNGDKVEYGWTVGKSDITGDLEDFIYSRLAEDYKYRIRAYQHKVEDTDWRFDGNKDREVVADMVSKGWLFAPSQEGKHFDVTAAKDNISYKENKDSATETKTKWTVSMSTLMAAAENAAVPNTLDINLIFEDNTYRVSYFYQDLVEMPEHTNGGKYEHEIGDEIFVDGDGHFSNYRQYRTNRMEFLIRDGQQKVKYAEPTQIPFNAESPEITGTIKWGELIGWKVVEFKYVSDGHGLPFLTELGKWKREYTTLGFLKVGDKMDKLTATQDGDVRLIGQYKTKTYTINFSNGADQLNGATPTGKMDSVNVKIDEEKKVLNRFEADGYSITNWFVDGNKDKRVYPRWNLADAAPEQWETQMNILKTRDILLKADLNNTTITVTPLWEAYDVMVNYHPNGGKLEPEKVNNCEVFEEAIGKDIELTNPIGPAGYMFDGWFFDKGFGRELAVNGAGDGRTWSIPANTGSDIDVYAKWVPKVTTITFNSNYPAELGKTAEKHAETYAYNADVKIWQSAFNATGYTLAGWSKTSDGPVEYPAAGKVCFAFESDAQDLFAVWTKAGDEFPITILSGVKAAVPDGWSGTSEKLTASFRFGNALSLPKLVPADELGKKNYTFKGYVDEYGNTVKSIGKKTVGPQVLYALWAGKKYSVTYYANAPQGFKASGKMAKQTVFYGENWAPLNCGFDVPGWKFIGWGITKDAVTPLYDFRAAGLIGEEEFTAPFNFEKWTYTENRKLYGIWEAAEDSFCLYTGYPKSGLEGSENNIRINGWEMESDEWTGASNGYFTYRYKTTDLPDGKMQLPTAEDMTDTQGMTFEGWYKANRIGDEIYGTKGGKVTTVKAGDHNIYMAKWSGKVTINYWNGNECVSGTADIGKKVKLQNMPKAWEDKGKILAGWAIGDHVHAMWKPGEKVDWDVIESSNYLLRTTADSTVIDLYAVWVPSDETYTVTFYDSSKTKVAKDTFSYSKGISEKQLKKIGEAIVENDNKVSKYYGFKYYHSPNVILGGEENLKLIRKVPKKTAGNLELIIAGSASPRKIKLSFDNNAPAGVKVTGKIGKRTVKEGSGIILLGGFEKLKAEGYKLVGFSLRKDGYKPFYPVAEDGSVLILDNTTMEHLETKDRYFNWENSVFDLTDNDSATLYAVWEEVTSEKDAFYYYDLAADDAYFDAEVPLAYTAMDYAKHEYDEFGNLIGWENLGLLAPHSGPNKTDYWYQFVPAGDSEQGIEGYSARQAFPIPARPGYTFAGWVEKDVKGGNVSAYAFSGDTIRYLTATWIKAK